MFGKTRGKYWVTEPDQWMEPRGVNDIGGGGEPPRTIIDCFKNTVEKFGDRPAMALKRETLGMLQYLFTHQYDDWSRVNLFYFGSILVKYRIFDNILWN